ncbi:LPS export ABC transporter ATP-binding protein [Halanaerobium congolense]|jgi:lipopolysaccharide export system ATP-binding protein|uniref:Lipopolysaccharide export system ATP-binding protein n=1 Tax=Halanaerobium congolense TaxID=54121 RepID=A0A1M7LQA1_9FIRM|nr:LPS export ABC transporter ATP-binding protein [Halanaerobium congolense]PUU93314.1 MAG: lipopolysaccharide export system ATP-binding protein [Halanaerobium sp.]PTX15790.1 lipopolysaccharide export system ATP-binding protein [Halanaerobium congolense]TDX45247.1 lipopolysaccharide export system ATP-binding protein [Halanaerobium congolense]SDF22228.1 lipopolysaccharide export system ATP-binding protein [Halanaerobium congolense]SDH27101.1 lipopolysaccharide export system ATP-binding protein 
MTIRAEALIKEYNKERVVNEVDLQVERGEIVGLLGPNGAGKTTTFYMILGLINPDGGEIYLDQHNISKFPVYKRARLGIGYLPQEASIFRKLTVGENLKAILEYRDLSNQEMESIITELLAEFHIENLRNRKGFQLSGGERRRVEIARALAADPAFILLDEPFAGVDPIAVNDIQEIIKYLKNRGLGVLITDHGVRETLSITDRAYIMHEGKILLSGTADEIADNELARKFYLGDKFKI